jgi:hypothetical protein
MMHGDIQDSRSAILLSLTLNRVNRSKMGIEYMSRPPSPPIKSRVELISGEIVG